MKSVTFTWRLVASGLLLCTVILESCAINKVGNSTLIDDDKIYFLFNDESSENGTKPKEILKKVSVRAADQGKVRTPWRCPIIDERPAAECSCDLPHTLRCAGDHLAIQIIGRHLKDIAIRSRTSSLNSAVSLLDCALRGVNVLMTSSVSELRYANLHGLVISSGELRRVQQGAFKSLNNTLQALGLPNNQLADIPTESLLYLYRLERLDLSNNKVRSMDTNSFKGLGNLTFIDMSDNLIKSIALDTFKPLNFLRILRLKSNQLTIESLTSLRELKSLKELDLSDNNLAGPLGPNTIPALKFLHFLQVGNNMFTSVRRGALAGLTNLTFLGLHNNKIDVIEDHAFRQLANLTEIDLSHNEIVAISGNSLAHLGKLKSLDLSRNFLRSLSAEPFRPLISLNVLMLHDNDVSIVDDDALSDHEGLLKFTISDNPLNCDCFMSNFAKWLREAKQLQITDVSAATCATPPHLEGALLFRLSHRKLCEDQDSQSSASEKTYIDSNDELISGNNLKNTSNITQDKSQYSDDLDVENNDEYDDGYDYSVDDNPSDKIPYLPAEDLPISLEKVVLESFSYDGNTIRLRWYVPAVRAAANRITNEPYTIPKAQLSCDASFVYERLGTRDHLLSAEPLNCPGSPDPITGTVDVIVPGSRDLTQGKSYRFCIALLESPQPALIVGCTGAIVLRAHPAASTEHPIIENSIRISGVRSNVTAEGTLSVEVALFGYPPVRPQNLQRTNAGGLSIQETLYFKTINNCYVILTVYAQESLIAQRNIQCDDTCVRMEGFMQGPYKVCATMSEYRINGPHSMCVSAQKIDKAVSAEITKGHLNLNIAVLGASLILLTILGGMICIVKKMLKKPKNFEATHQVFRPEAPIMAEEAQHSRYVKLQATSKV